jgi:hypothetical protein
MTARNSAGQFAKVDPAEQVLQAACSEVVAAIRLGRRVGRVVPTTHLAKRLEIAAEEAAMLDDGAS